MRRFCRIFFSRYALCALFILFEIALIAYFVFYFSIYSFAFLAMAAIINILVFINLINKEINPEFKLTWLVVVMLMPLLGGIIYIIFFPRRLSRRDAKFMKEMFSSMEEAEREGIGYISSDMALRAISEKSVSAAGRAYSLLADDSLARIYTGCVSSYFSSGEEFYQDLLHSLADAKKYIFIETFILAEGKMWNGIHSILSEKIREGVEVRILYDDIGSMSSVPYNFDAKLREEGIECHRFGKVTPRLVATHNNRDHRKIYIIDGESAYTGGINIADEYINVKERFGHWKDGGIKLLGEAARGFLKLFLGLYDLTVGSMSNYSEYFQRPESAVTDGTGFFIPFGSGPAPVYPTPVGKNTLENIIDFAESYLYITTPYLILDYDLTEALRSAAKRGVDVRIITPGIPDKKLIKLMTKSAYPRLMEAGVRIFEYTKGFIHEKSVVCDGTLAMIGTINLDYRSLVHHFEDGVWIFDDEVVLDIRDGFMQTERSCLEILEADAKLSFTEKVIKNLVRIFAPLL